MGTSRPREGQPPDLQAFPVGAPGWVRGFWALAWHGEPTREEPGCGAGWEAQGQGTRLLQSRLPPPRATGQTQEPWRGRGAAARTRRSQEGLEQWPVGWHASRAPTLSASMKGLFRVRQAQLR